MNGLTHNGWRVPEEFLRRASSPAYLFDLDAFAGRIEAVRSGLSGRALLCYAIKANPFLTKAAANLADRLEVCSPGEARICERLGVPADKIVLSGVWKEEEDIRRLIRLWRGANIFTVESQAQFHLLRRLCEEERCPLCLLLRLSSGNQFGMDEAAIREIVANRADYPQLTLLGLQFYSGTQKKNMETLRAELCRLDGLLLELSRAYGYRAGELEYGPGFYIPYFQKDSFLSDGELLAQFTEMLGSLSFSGRVTLEMGRYLAAPCGCYLSTVREVKRTDGVHYAILDGGIHHLNYYGQTMAMKQPPITLLPSDDSKRQSEDYQLCGALCTVGDVLVRRLSLPQLTAGDRLLFFLAGAYTVTEGIYLFLSRDLPEIYFWSQKDGLALVRAACPTDVLNAPEA